MLISVLICAFFCKISISQNLSPLNHYYLQQIEQNTKQKRGIYTVAKPIDLSKISKIINLDSILLREKYNYDKSSGYIKRKLFYEPAILVDDGDFYLNIDPVFNFQGSLDPNKNDILINNTRGIQAKGNIGKKLYFFTDFYENQSFFPEYLSDFISDNTIVPGQGIAKPFKENGYDFAFASGIISYSPNQTFNFQFGHGKNFIGNGYRSLLLSDNSFNYPFLKVTTSTPWFQYTNLFTSFLDLNINELYQGGFQRKYGSFHFLEFNLGWIEIGTFQAVIWETRDSVQKGGYEFKYLNPIIFYEPLVNSFREPNNSMLGLNLKIIPFNNFHLYGQFIIDNLELSKMKESGYILNKTGYQAGFKYFDLFTINDLYFQTEYNSVRPYVFAHNNQFQNYTHYQQALAHPLGANFNELVTIVNYRYKNFFLQLKVNYAIYGADTTGTHWGKDIFKSDLEAQYGYPSDNAVFNGGGSGNNTTQGIKTNLLYLNPELSYILNPNSNMQISIGVIKRQLKSETVNDDLLLLYLSFKTTLNNIYYDF